MAHVATQSISPAVGARLPAYSLFGATLAGAGLPIYMYAPKYFADTYGVSLALLGTVLFVLRLIDVVQDPILGWISERLGPWRPLAAAGGAALLGGSMLALFAVPPPVAPVVWFGIAITGLFTAYSFLKINFYAQGVAKAATVPGGHAAVAGWRETGALLGVCIAAMAPTLLGYAFEAAYTAYALAFAAVTVLAALAMSREWSSTLSAEPTPLSTIVRDATTRRLLLLGMLNAAPGAVTSTLFLFFVESRIGAPGLSGPLLVAFFLSAAASAPFWSWASGRFGVKRVLMIGMSLAILIFVATLFIGEGDVIAFAVICVLTGATIGADLTLLPAIFAARMARVAPNAGQGFGLWALVSKFALAFAAVLVLPALQFAGFDSAADSQPQTALLWLTILYAGLPCLLKLGALALLATTRLEETLA